MVMAHTQRCSINAQLQCHIGCICLTFLHCAFLNVSSKHQLKKMQSYIGCNCAWHCELCSALWIVRGIVNCARHCALTIVGRGYGLITKEEVMSQLRGRKRLYERKEVMVWSLRSAHWLTNKGRYRAARAAKKQQTTKQQQQQQNNNNKTITTNKNNNNKTRYSTKTTFVKNCVRHCTLWKRLCHNWESSQVGQVGRSEVGRSGR